MLPSALRALLRQAPRVVVAPVGRGFGQEALTNWAEKHGYRVVHSAAETQEGRALWCPRRRRELHALPRYAPIGEVLVLDETQARWDFQSWSAALAHHPVSWQRASYEQSDGWPEALKFALQLADNAGELHRHPLATAYLTPLLPPPTLRDVYQRLAVTPLVLPALYALLQVSPDDIEALHDGGWLSEVPGGLAAPRLLRRALAPRGGPQQAQEIALVLSEAGQDGAALDVLAEAGAWHGYLDVLVRVAKASTGEDVLRDRLRPVPPVLREKAEYRYLAGLLARTHGELAHAEALYDQALHEAPASLAPLVHNARGVILALQHRTDEALSAFEQATGGAGVTAGEAWHNHAGLLAQLGRHGEAEQSLKEAVAAFRAVGDEAREARSFKLLGLLYTERGLLHEAQNAYREALKLLRNSGAALDAFAFLNLAEVHALLGHPDEAQSYLDQARASAPDTRAQGWLTRCAALIDLQRGRLDAAQGALEALLTSEPTDRQLLAEIHLLLTRTLREKGKRDEARVHLEGALPLGVRAELEAALLSGEGLDAVIEHARAQEFRLELASALVARGSADDAREALRLTRTHGYAALLEGPDAVKLAAHVEEDESLRELFPLHLTLLGPLKVRFAGRTLSLADFPTRKSAALLLALAFAGRPYGREELAERFWPGAKNPLGSLQTAVYHLRGALGVPVVRSERGLLSLAFPVQTDLQALQASGQQALLLHEDAGAALLRESLRTAGSFLPELPDEFEDERAHAEATLRELRWTLARLSPGESEVRRDALRALLADDPYDLDARATLIRVHELRGENEAAAHERRRLAELEREFG
ncbi:tetratricopeptide repeat protein [Deinococcus peraridilitoris]|nr:tetratricopeptide repeat protein [Deinococcus peraridilitoris]